MGYFGIHFKKKTEKSQEYQDNERTNKTQIVEIITQDGCHPAIECCHIKAPLPQSRHLLKTRISVSIRVFKRCGNMAVSISLFSISHPIPAIYERHTGQIRDDKM